MIGFCILISLGIWQLKRLAWKENLIAQIQTQQALPPIELSSANPSVFRRVSAVGKFNYDRELRLMGRTVNQQMGYYLFTPLTLLDGRIIYVNRGWAPQTVADQDISRPAGTIRIEGILKDSMSRNAFTPENRYDRREIFTFNPQEIAAKYPDKKVMLSYLDATWISSPGTYPQLKPLGVHLRNNHLLYALTWFALAGGLAIVCVIFIRKKRHNP